MERENRPEKAVPREVAALRSDSWRRSFGIGRRRDSGKRDSGSGPHGSNRDSLMSFSKRGQVTIQRPIYTETKFHEGFTADSRPQGSLKDTVRKRLRDSCACSKDCTKNFFLHLFPFLTILKGYTIKKDFVSDIISGLTVGIMHIPQGMAYALLASMSPVNGLYVSFFPVLVYFFFGSSRHISIGTFAVICLMVGSVVERECPDSEDEVSTNYTLIVNDTSGYGNDTATTNGGGDSCKVKVAVTLTLMVGVFQLLMGILRMGFVTIYLSQPLVSGFTTGAACHVLTSQIKYILGIVPRERFNGAFKLIKNYIELFSQIEHIVWAELIASCICILVIALTKECINARFKSKMKMPVPIDLIIVVLGTLISHFAHLHETFQVRIVGDIPTGFPIPQPPKAHLLGDVAMDAFVIAIVSFAVSVSLAKILAKKNNYEIDSNQELVAHGMTNIVSSFFNCFTASGSLSRSLVQETMGGKTQVAGLVSSSLVLIVLLAIGQYFRSLPNCVLASIIVVALKGMFLQFKDLKHYWNISKYDFAIWLITWAAVVILDVDFGLGIGVGFSLLTVVFRTQRPYVASLGRIPHTDIYKDTSVYTCTKDLQGIKIIRFEASLYYANVEHFRQRVYSMSDANPLTMAARRNKFLANKKIEEAELHKKQEKKEQMVELNGNVVDKTDPSTSVAMEEEPLAPATDVDLPKYDVHHIILDCSMMSYIDTVGVGVLGQLITEYKKIGIDVFLANCKAGVRDMLFRAGFYDSHDKEILYVSTHDAVLAAVHKRLDILEELRQDTAIVTAPSMQSLPTRASRSSTFMESYLNQRNSYMSHDCDSDEEAILTVLSNAGKVVNVGDNKREHISDMVYVPRGRLSTH